MAHTSTYALIIYGVGCVIPTPLEQQSQPINFPPTIAADKSRPAFGPIKYSAQDTVELSVAADDPNSDDTLVARVFYQNVGSTTRNWNGNEIKLLPPSTPEWMPPYQRTGAFPPLHLCEILPHPGTTYVYVIVADRPFKPTEDDQSAGLVSENHWEITCT